MDIREYILDGLESALTLERELGVRSVECDREVLAGVNCVPPATAPVASSGARSGAPATISVGVPRAPATISVTPRAPATPHEPPTTIHDSRTTIHDYIYLHHSPLSQRGEEMMTAIITKLGKSREATPIVTEPPLPRAKLYVVLGGRAMNKFFPEVKGAPGQWITTDKNKKLLITYSPEYILRFTEVTPAVKKIKLSLWTSLKLIAQKQGDNKQ